MSVKCFACFRHGSFSLISSDDLIVFTKLFYNIKAMTIIFANSIVC